MLILILVIIMKNKDYIILEIIPTSSNPSNGSIIQLSALKLQGLNLIDRFDYRLKDEFLPIKEMKSWIDYDEDLFTYVDSDIKILEYFSKWSNDLPILIIDNVYTPLYLSKLNNSLEYIYDYLDLEYSDYLIDEVINKYNLQPSNYIVDLLYEALIMHYQ